MKKKRFEFYDKIRFEFHEKRGFEWNEKEILNGMNILILKRFCS